MMSTSSRKGVLARTLLGCASLAILVVACDDEPTGVSNTDVEVREEFSFDITLANQTRITLLGINGNVVVTGSAGATSFSITGERIVRSESLEDAQEFLEMLEVEVTGLSDEVLVRTLQPQNTGGRQLVVNYEVTIPDDMVADIENINGNMDVTGINNTVGAVTINGNVTLEEIEGSVGAGSVNGNVDAEVTMPTGGFIAMATTNGNVTLEVPTSISAELSATVVNGIVSVIDLTLQNQQSSPTMVTGTLGAGDGDITMVTTNGNVVVRGF